MLTDDNQQVVWEAEYTPFGEANLTVEQVVNNLRFPGQYFDQETGIHYNYFRYYNPSVGRYITSDPIGLDGGINTYSYVFNNPLYLSDIYGLAPGDLFNSYSEALSDSRTYAESSKYYRLIEYGGWVYQVGKCWTYNFIDGTPDKIPFEALEEIKPNYPHSQWHTHPGRGAGNPSQQIHSDGDKDVAKHHGIPVVLFPPDGGAISYDPISRKITDIDLPNVKSSGGNCECDK